jgi:hypothetical protein
MKKLGISAVLVAVIGCISFESEGMEKKDYYTLGKNDGTSIEEYNKQFGPRHKGKADCLLGTYIGTGGLLKHGSGRSHKTFGLPAEVTKLMGEMYTELCKCLELLGGISEGLKETKEATQDKTYDTNINLLYTKLKSLVKHIEVLNKTGYDLGIMVHFVNMLRAFRVLLTEGTPGGTLRKILVEDFLSLVQYVEFLRAIMVELQFNNMVVDTDMLQETAEEIAKTKNIIATELGGTTYENAVNAANTDAMQTLQAYGFKTSLDPIPAPVTQSEINAHITTTTTVPRL